MRDGKSFLLKNASFYVEPTISRATGRYSVNIVPPARHDFSVCKEKGDAARTVLIGLAGNLASVCDPVLPPNYHFSIIDKEGNILFHSQTERSLHENLFEESNENDGLKNAVDNKDSVLLDDVPLFGRTSVAMQKKQPDYNSL